MLLSQPFRQMYHPSITAGSKAINDKRTPWRSA